MTDTINETPAAADAVPTTGDEDAEAETTDA